MRIELIGGPLDGYAFQNQFEALDEVSTIWVDDNTNTPIYYSTKQIRPCYKRREGTEKYDFCGYSKS